MKKLAKIALAASAALTAPSMAFADWYEVRTDQFVVYSDAAEDEAVEFAELMERYDRAMRITQNIPFEAAKSDAQRVTVFHWGDIGDISHLASMGRTRQGGVAGFYIARAGQPVAFSPMKGPKTRRAGSRQRNDRRTQLDTESVLLHEYAHSFMLQHFPATYPSWYVEGFAEFYGQIEFLEDGSFHLGNPPQYRGDFLKRGPSYHIKDLFDTKGKLTGLDQINWYTTGWLTLHYLTFAPERQGQLGDFLTRIQKGEDSRAAAEAAFGSLNQLNSDVWDHLKRGDMPGYNVKPQEFQMPEVTVRQLSEAEADIIEYRMRSWRGVDEKMADWVQGKVRDKADLSQDSILIAMTVAEAEFDAEAYAQSEAAAQRALEIDPSHSKAHLYLARIDAKMAEEADEETAGSGAAKWEEARAHFLDAIAADRNDPLPLFEYYMTYRDAEQEPTEQALVALETAYTLAPYDTGVRGTLVRQLAEEGKAMLAADLVTPIVFAPHGNDDVEELREAMLAVRNGQREEGAQQMVAFFDRLEKEAEEEEESIHAH